MYLKKSKKSNDMESNRVNVQNGKECEPFCLKQDVNSHTDVSHYLMTKQAHYGAEKKRSVIRSGTLPETKVFEQQDITTT